VRSGEGRGRETDEGTEESELRNKDELRYDALNLEFFRYLNGCKHLELGLSAVKGARWDLAVDVRANVLANLAVLCCDK
jgi:hypothetical protein